MNILRYEKPSIKTEVEDKSLDRSTIGGRVSNETNSFLENENNEQIKTKGKLRLNRSGDEYFISDEKKEMIVDCIENQKLTRARTAKKCKVSLASISRVYNQYLENKISNENQNSKKDYRFIPEETKTMIIDSLVNGSCTRTTAAKKFNVSYISVMRLHKQYLENNCNEESKHESDENEEPIISTRNYKNRISYDIRKMIFDGIKSGKYTAKSAAKKYKVSYNSANRIYNQFINNELRERNQIKMNANKIKVDRKKGSHISDKIKKMIIDSIQNGTCSRISAAKKYGVSYGSAISIYNGFLKGGKKDMDTEDDVASETLSEKPITEMDIATEDNNIQKSNESNYKLTRDYKSISEEKKKIIIESIKSGKFDRKSAAKKFNVPYTTVNRLYNRYLNTQQEIENKRGPIKKILGGRRRGRRITKETRAKIIESIEDGTCTRQTAAQKFNINYWSVVAIYRQHLHNQGNSPNPRNGATPNKLSPEHVELLKKIYTENNKYTNAQLKARLWEEFDLEVSLTDIAQVLETFSFTLKRTDKVALPTLTPDQVSERKLLCNHFLYASNSDRQVIYFGKASFDISMRQMVNGSTSEVSRDTMKITNNTLMVSMTREELLHYKVVDGPKYNLQLKTFVKELLLLLEKRNIVGGLIIIDESIFNEYEKIIESIEAAGHLSIILTEISRFLNPVENVSLDWANYLRSKIPTNQIELDVAINSFKGTMTKDVCAKYCKLAVDNARRSVDKE